MNKPTEEVVSEPTAADLNRTAHEATIPGAYSPILDAADHPRTVASVVRSSVVAARAVMRAPIMPGLIDQAVVTVHTCH
jgi:hypothetical protein